MKFKCTNKKCKKVNSIDYKDNSGRICVGIIHPTKYPTKDVIRSCHFSALRVNGSFEYDSHICEVLDLMSLLSEAISLYFDGVDLEKLERRST